LNIFLNSVESISIEFIFSLLIMEAGSSESANIIEIDSRYFRGDLRAYNDNGHSTETSVNQIKVEEALLDLFNESKEKHKNDLDELLYLFRGNHLNFLEKSLFNLGSSYATLDSSRPWLVYWITQSIALLGYQDLLKKHAMIIANFLKACVNQQTGGYGGSPGSIAHLATTYAAINALVSLKSRDALETIDRERLRNFLMLMKCKNGSFRMHFDGEKDVRGAYCAISVASICNILDDELIKNTPEWIQACQTYEGGFGPTPRMEAHGGYTFCSVACLMILKKSNLIKFEPLIRWLSNKQMANEGGFCGRTNKLVDGCYSFWQCAVFPLVHFYFENKVNQKLDSFLFDQKALQEYCLLFCQCKTGGLRDKPGKSKDLYHSCYVLAGLSIAQNGPLEKCVLGSPSNELESIDPKYNLTYPALCLAKKFFET